MALRARLDRVLQCGWQSPGIGAVVAAAICCVAADNAHAQLAGGGLSDTGLGNGTSLRDQVSSILAPASTVNTGLPWTFSGDVDVEAGATNSPGGSGGGWQPVMLISPDFNLTGVTSRLNVALSYSPRFSWYPTSDNQTFLSHSFNGNATATVVPDWLFLNARGLTSVGSRFGDTSLLSNTFLSQNEAVQTSSFSISPYVSHTIGGWGTFTAGYIYNRTFQGDYNNFGNVALVPDAANSAGFGALGNLSTNTEFATFTTGQNLGRVQDSISVTASQNSGSVFYDGSSTLQANNTVSYALYRWLTLLATGGYEEDNYPHSGYRLNEPTWLIGATVTPNPDSTVTVEYGRTAGTNTVLANGTYSPTARTRVYGSYTVGIQTGLGARQSLLGSTTVGTGGLLVDRITGIPVISNNSVASQYPLSRVKTLTIGGVVQYDRDTVSASVNYTVLNQLVSSTDIFGVATSSGTATQSTYATLNWQHELNPSTSLNSSVTYGIDDSGVYFSQPGTSYQTVQLYSGLNHSFTDSLSGSVSYSHAQRFGTAVSNLPAVLGGTTSQDTFLVGLRKSF
jgi:hypothetical protein